MMTYAGLALAVVLVAPASRHTQHTHPPQPTTSQGMNFSQSATSHHFRLSPAGGSIEVHVNDPADSATRGRVQSHLQVIAAEFAKGNFSTPFAVHGEMPPGAEVMASRRSHMTYSYEESSIGGRVIITSADPAAVEALHTFLRYQIREHNTGDSTSVLK